MSDLAPPGTSPLDVAHQVLLREARAIYAIAERVNVGRAGFHAALSLALDRVGRGGKLVFTGVGKSGTCGWR